MGVAAALMILQPKEPEMIVAGGVAAMAGALFPDTDSGNSGNCFQEKKQRRPSSESEDFFLLEYLE